MDYSFEEFLTEGMESGAWVAMIPPRPLSPDEEALIAMLLSHEFTGAQQLRRQLPTVKVIAEAKGDDPGIKMSPSRESNLAASVLDRVPVEAKGKDSQGNEVDVLLHVVAGFLAELEIVAWETKPVGLPSLKELVVI
jgi:hypothetical protein